MLDWLNNYYLEILVNLQILLGHDLLSCSAVDRLKIFSAVMFGIFVLRIILHHLILRRLRNDSEEYTEANYPALVRLYHEAAASLRLRRIPRLYQFCNRKPLVFTIGTIRPAVFLAPRLLDKLDNSELRAVLLHELTHVKRRDSLLVWLLESGIVIFPLLVIGFFAWHFAFSVTASTLAMWSAILFVVIFRGLLWRWLLFLRELSCDDGAIKAKTDPLVLASAILNVSRESRLLPSYGWRSGLAFSQTLLPATAQIEMRTRRLLNYKWPWFKFFLAKLTTFIVAIALTFITLFVWQFHKTHGNFSVTIEHSDACHRHQVVLVEDNG